MSRHLYEDVQDTKEERQAWIRKHGSLQGYNQFGENYKQYLETINKNHGIRQADYGAHIGRSGRSRNLYEIKALTRDGTPIPKKEVTAFGAIGKSEAKRVIREKARHKWIRFYTYNVTRKKRNY